MHWFNAALMGVALVLTVVTGIDYLVKAVRYSRSAGRAD
jgi:hypothetical protein